MLTRKFRLVVALRFLTPHIIGFTLWSALVVVIHTLGHYPERLGLEPGWLSAASDWMAWSSVGIPFSAIAALGGALAIFLGFRNNSAYDRWWEARKIWGALVNDSRSFGRQVMAWTEPKPGAADEPSSRLSLQTELVHRHLAFVHGLAHHLRGQREALRASVERFVSPAEAERIAAAPNLPTALLIEQGKRIAIARADGQIEHFRHLEMDGMLTRLSDIQGRCERIKNTPIPRQYDAFPRWFAYFYGAMLPFGLSEPIGWGAVPVGVSIALVFLCLEVSGRVIEDPFEDAPTDVPISTLSIVIERDLRAALGEPVPEALQPDARGIAM